jgi:hypothetical protein
MRISVGLIRIAVNGLTTEGSTIWDAKVIAFTLGVGPLKTFTFLELSSNISSWSSEVCTLKGKITHLKLDVNRLTCTVSDVRCGVAPATNPLTALCRDPVERATSPGFFF